MKAQSVGLAGLRGWRSSVADAVASPVADRSPLRRDQIRASVGAIFLLMSIIYVFGAVRDLLRDDV
ncbi:hypothetical protein [Ilumatobacter sp.]|uniref:hypothetical protein n=1 Tax=Ilumatobacter sp. TaxID=1967498 RepID=UPI003C510EEA